jgi:hypothetical protein
MSFDKRVGDRWQVLVGYTIANAEETSTDFQSAFLPQTNGRGRNPADPKGLPIAFRPDDERGPAVQDQRHRLVVSGSYAGGRGIQVSGILTAGSGRPYNILAGADLNGDGDGGSSPADRARTNPADPASSVGRNSGTLPPQATVDLRITRRFSPGATGSRLAFEPIVEVFNLFNRANFTGVQNVFGAGSYPLNPLPTFGQFTQAAPPRQVQLAVKVIF